MLTISRPLSKVVAKSGESPRTLMTWARPATRCAARPGRRAIDSAMLTSGNLPMSSAETASTIEVASFFTASALSMPARMPVTSMASSSAGSCLARRLRAASAASSVAATVAGSDDSCASTNWACIRMADASAALSTLRLNFTMDPSTANDSLE